jgi:hypothetical protein
MVWQGSTVLVTTVVETAVSMFGYVMCGIQPKQLQLVQVRAQIAWPAFYIPRTASVTYKCQIVLSNRGCSEQQHKDKTFIKISNV